MKRILFLIFFLTILNTTWALDVPQVTVQGHCEVKVVPDRGVITFSAENQSKDQKEAVKKTTAQINKLKEAIKALNLRDLELKNTNYTVYPVREYEKERYVDKGTRVSLSLEVTTSEITRLGETMTAASEVGIGNVGSLTTFLSTEKSRSEYLKCLDIAAMDAQGKASQLGKKLGFKVGEVINLTETPNIEPPIPMEQAMLKGTRALSASTQVEAGTQRYSTNIQVTFSIK